MKRLTEYKNIGEYAHAILTGDLDKVIMRLAKPKQCENAKAVKAERIQELLKADKDGRLVILPCKMGDTVYYIRRTFDGTDVVGEAELWWSDIPYIGKTIFLTREEAEKALEERK